MILVLVAATRQSTQFILISCYFTGHDGYGGGGYGGWPHDHYPAHGQHHGGGGGFPNAPAPGTGIHGRYVETRKIPGSERETQ